ncbi:MAG: DNA polymerase III subunit delta' C-terminal domain-containing protein, partial [Herbaspirillum sp.]
LQDFLQQLTHPNDVAGALKIAEQLQKIPLIEPVAWLQRWLYDLLALKLAGRVRYYPRYQTQLQALAARSTSVSLVQATGRLNGRNATARHPLSPKLFLEDMLLDYSTIFC